MHVLIVPLLAFFVYVCVFICMQSINQKKKNQVVWSHLYKTSSSLDVGTLYQLRTLINRRNVTSDVRKDMNA